MSDVPRAHEPSSAGLNGGRVMPNVPVSGWVSGASALGVIVLTVESTNVDMCGSGPGWFSAVWLGTALVLAISLFTLSRRIGRVWARRLVGFAGFVWSIVVAVAAYGLIGVAQFCTDWSWF